MSAELERTIERVWTLAGCVAELRWAAGRPITQEELIAELLDVKSPGITWGFARPRRADLAKFRDELPAVAANLEQQHGALVRELASWRPAKLEQRHEALEVAARLASRDTEEEAALLERAVDTAAHCLGALLAAERRLDKRERGEAKRTSPERVASPGALTAAAEEAATDGRQ